MDWDKIRIFHAVAVAGSFTKAGEILGLSQSAVSRQISSLEEELSTALFHRHARGLLLTEQGELLYRTAHDVVGRLTLAESILKEGKENPSGELKVTAPVGLGSTWLTPRLKEFMELYPQIQVNLILEDHALDLSMREADVALRIGAPSQSDLIQRKLMVIHHHFYAAPSYLQKHGAPQTAKDLDDHIIISYGSSLMPNPNPVNWIEYVGRETDDPRTPALTVNNIYGVKQAVQAGMGIGVLPDYLVQENTNVVQLLSQEIGPSFDIYYVYPEELRNSKRISVFRDFLLRKISEWTF